MNIEKQIEFDRIKELWCESAVTEAAKKMINDTGIFCSELELRKNMQDTTDSKLMLEKYGTPPLQEVSEVSEMIKSAKQGICLTPFQLEAIVTALAAVGRLKDYLCRGKADYNQLAYYEENLFDVPELREEISRQIRNGQVDDYASRDLQQVRMQIIKEEEQMRQKAEAVMRTHKDCMADNFSTMKNGRVCVPVKKDCKFKVAGSVIDKSASGATLFIEPASVANAYEEIQKLRVLEENEVYRILYTLSAMVADCADVMDENIKTIEKMDYIFSKGKFSIDLDAVEPRINTGRKIFLKDARHPLMDKSICVPLQFEMDEKRRGIVITGPNTGGKTVSIKTVMLNNMMAQCGLHVTCKEADICMNSSYLCDIGDGQNLSENLSTFSAHIKNVLQVLSEVGSDSFVIMDELGSGTDPTEGMGIAVAILEELRKSGANFLVTTHYPEVKDYANKTDNIVNARMTFDKENLRPTYQMVIGEAGESCAFYIADKLGMPKNMLETAINAAYGKEALENYNFQTDKMEIEKKVKAKINRIAKTENKHKLANKFSIGDSVMIYPDKKIGIVCERVNEKGVLRVQLRDKKIWINHKRVKLVVAAEKLYPQDYDFSIIFDSIDARKKRHDMSRKLTDEVLEYEE